MEGLSEGIGTGYAQILPAGEDNLRNVIAWQERAMKLDADKKNKAEEDKKAVGKELSASMGKIPTDLYSEHNPIFEQKKKQFFDYTYQNVDKLEMGTPERMEWEQKKNELTVFANQSKNFREAVESLKKQEGDLSQESVDYLAGIKKGVDEQGNPILTVDNQMLYSRPDFSKVYAHPEVARLGKGIETETAGTPVPTSIKGVYQSKNTKVKEITQADIDAAAQFGWDNMNDATKSVTIKDMGYRMNKGDKEMEPYKQFVTITQDANGNDVADYSVAAEEYVKDKYRKNKKPIKVTSTKKQFIYDPSIKRGSGDDVPKVETQVNVVEENRNVISSVESGNMKGKQWYSAIDENGKRQNILRDPNTKQYYKPKNPNSLDEWELISEDEMDTYDQVQAVTVGGQKKIESIIYNDPKLETKQVQWKTPYVINEDGSVKDTGLPQGILGTPKEVKIAWVTKSGKQYDKRPETGDAELKILLTVADKKGKLKTFPMDKNTVQQLKKDYAEIDLELWDEYNQMKANESKPAQSKPAASKPAQTKAAASPTSITPEEKKKYSKYKRNK